jgi:hypothetical protein
MGWMMRGGANGQRTIGIKNAFLPTDRFRRRGAHPAPKSPGATPMHSIGIQTWCNTHAFDRHSGSYNITVRARDSRPLLAFPWRFDGRLNLAQLLADCVDRLIQLGNFLFEGLAGFFDLALAGLANARATVHAAPPQRHLGRLRLKAIFSVLAPASPRRQRGSQNAPEDTPQQGTNHKSSDKIVLLTHMTT